MHVKRRLVAWRKRQGLSQREAAAKAGVSQAAWNSYEDEDSTSCPGVNAALSIEEVTSGAIVVADWRQADSAKAIRKAKAAHKRVRRLTTRRTGTDG